MGIPVWKDVVGYEGLYQVSTDGRVRSLFRYKKELKPNITRNDYATVELFKNKQNKRLLIHRLVAIAFIENTSNLPQVNHIDENKLNNTISNLEWQTAKENMNYGTRQERQKQNTDYSNETRKIIARENGQKARKPILQYDKNGTLIATYASARQASKLLKINASHIAECCKGKLKTSRGFIWKYKEVV